MGIDLTLTKGYGFLVPMEFLGDSVHERLETLEEDLPKELRFGTSGSFWMSGPQDGDQVWVSLASHTESESPKYSDGFHWIFREQAEPEEQELLLSVAADFFPELTEVVIEPFVILSVH